MSVERQAVREALRAAIRETALVLGRGKEMGTWVPSWDHRKEMRERQKFPGACTVSEGAGS